MHGLLIHGGAGSLPKRAREGNQAKYEASLQNITNSAFLILDKGGSSLDAVTLAVQMLEDDPLFNAGRGAVLTRKMTAELDAAIMDGSNETAGAVACLNHIKNPISLARLVMERTRHVFLVGSGAEDYAVELGFELVPNSYFHTAHRTEELSRVQKNVDSPTLISGDQGTVGAVALDAQGNLAAATSTGGVVNKLPGRVGDTPIIGAGTFAKNGICAVSATGQGEYFIRTVAAHHVSSAVEHRELSLESAVAELLHEKLSGLGGTGGIIAIGADGKMVADFNTEMMFYGAQNSSGLKTVGIWSKLL